MPLETQGLETQLALLKRDIDDVNRLFDKMDTTVTKLNEIAEYLSTLVKLHEERIAGVHIEIDDIKADIDKMKSEIYNDIRRNKTEVTKSVNDMKAKIEYYEKIKWMLMGGAAVIGYAISQMGFITSLFN